MFKPLPPIAGRFYMDDSRVAAIMGPVGSGKTTAAAMRLCRHALWQRPHEGVARSRFMIVRNTGPQLHDTTMKSWFKIFPSDGKFRKWTSTTKTQTWRFRPQGAKHIIHAEFVFRALDDDDDVANILGSEVTGFWFNELREIDPVVFAAAGGRTGRYPGEDMGGCTWHGRIGDTNPWAATSEFHEMFVANKRDGYEFFKQPGGMEPNAENVENLPGGREYYENLLIDMSKNDADMMVHCKYGASRAGKPVYQSYDDNTHCKSFELLKQKVKGVVATPIKIGYDNTGRTPAALIAQRTDAGQWRIRYEFIGEGMGLKAHVKELRRFLTEKIPDFVIEKITCDPAGRAKDSDELDMRMIVQKEFPGVTVVNARTNDIATRIEAFDGPLRRMVNGEPAVLIHPDCKILRTACLTKYQYRRLKIAGEDRYTEEPDKSAKPYDDIANAGQYLMLGGGEGRVNSDGQTTDANWPKDNKAVTPKAPDPKQIERNSRPVFDPRNGSVFRDGW